MPRPLDLSRFSGASGSATVSGIEALALVAHADRAAPARPPRSAVSNSTKTCFAGVVPVAVLDGVDHRLADRDADPVQRVVVEADVARHVVADHLHEVEHLERAGELEPDDMMAVDVMLVTRTEYHRPSMSRRDAKPQGRRKIDGHAAVAAATIAPARRVHGRVRVPGDKSISHRYALLAALAEGRSDADQFCPRSRLPVDARLPARRSGVEVGRRAGRHRYFDGTRVRASPFAGRRRSTPAIRGRRCGCWPGVLAGQPFSSRRWSAMPRCRAGRCAASSSRSSGWAPGSRPPTATPRSRFTARALHGHCLPARGAERPGQERRAAGRPARRRHDQRRRAGRDPRSHRAGARGLRRARRGRRADRVGRRRPAPAAARRSPCPATSRRRPSGWSPRRRCPGRASRSRTSA